MGGAEKIKGEQNNLSSARKPKEGTLVDFLDARKIKAHKAKVANFSWNKVS